MDMMGIIGEEIEYSYARVHATDECDEGYPGWT
jgi:hypothetical protein